MFVASLSYSADKAMDATKPPAPPPPLYDVDEALSSIMNPHEQISDEGDILWGTCTICHKNVPDIKKDKSIKDVTLRFGEDFNNICYECHVVKPHPAAEGASVTMSQMTAPNHLVVPSKNVSLNLRFALKDVPMILPLEQKTGKVICVTCHNPHERGVLSGKADYGADYSFRLRSAGLDICQYCHRK